MKKSYRPILALFTLCQITIILPAPSVPCPPFLDNGTWCGWEAARPQWTKLISQDHLRRHSPSQPSLCHPPSSSPQGLYCQHPGLSRMDPLANIGKKFKFIFLFKCNMHIDIYICAIFIFAGQSITGSGRRVLELSASLPDQPCYIQS